jgi:hypothetical protein
MKIELDSSGLWLVSVTHSLAGENSPQVELSSIIVESNFARALDMVPQEIGKLGARTAPFDELDWLAATTVVHDETELEEDKVETQ